MTSSLLDHDELEPTPAVKPSLRSAALLISISGVVALAGLIAQYFLTHPLSIVGLSFFWQITLGAVDAVTTFGLVLPSAACALGGVKEGVALRSHVTRRSVVKAIQCATVGVFLQFLRIAVAVILIAVSSTRSGQTIGDVLGPANLLTLASFLNIFAVAWVIHQRHWSRK